MDKGQKFSVWYFLIALVVAWLFAEYIYKPYTESKSEVPYSEFLADLDKNNIENVDITESRIIYALKEADSGDVEKRPIVNGIVFMKNKKSKQNENIKSVVRLLDPLLIERLSSADIKFGGVAKRDGLIDLLMGILLPMLPLIIIWYLIFRNMQGAGGGIFSFGRSRAKELQGEMTGVHFSDIGGAGEAEVELREIIEFLKEPKRFEKFGAKLPRGVLLVGPPGTGKTLLAKATAGEAGVPFFFITGSSFVEMFVGVGAARVRDLFGQAKKKAPCIIFVDEIDAIGQSRMNVINANSEQENTLNQILAEMDGFEPNNGVVIMGATNRPEILDQALMRPGRFDRQIQVVLPTEEGREEILKIHTKNLPLAPEINLRSIAKVTPGFSGADLANIANEASLLAARRKAEKVTMNDFDLAIERVVAGLQRKTPLTPEIRKKVAYHETGHALVACYLPGSDPVHKVSIIPTTKGALGYTMQMPTEDQYLISESELKNKMAVMLGGRAAELLIFNEASTGASNDLERATETARRMVIEFGMSEKLGPVRYASPSMTYLAGASQIRDDTGDGTAIIIDGEIRKFVTEAQDTALKILKEHEKVLHEVSEVLQEKEVINHEEIEEIVKRHQEMETPSD
ncbi:MAG: ATP-dependent zinc metalloprotease FtsH [Synergistaceae bacterium]|nr:ATP-dependent zinc metalloprotease FtsH [Synergistaceae bacterium]MBR0080364.1 ATP-dependent zinc metalloprotease FtsH [Synergistaceae bacterium]MBR0232932.1 ATP-dependent zinc metalloprotease FtsH [Synergistaceae bacterium]